MSFLVSTDGYISKGITRKSAGTLLTTDTLLCDLSGSLPLTGLLLSVSNNGVNQSNSVMYIFQDEVCYDCSPALQTCNLQPTSCLINGQCYAAGTYSPTDPCLVCNPVTNFWTFKPSASCTTTSISTSTRSSTSTPSSKSSLPSTTSSTTSSVFTSSFTVSSSISATQSPTPSKSSSPSSPNSSSSTSTSATVSTSFPASSTTEPEDTNGQDGDEEKNDQETFNIVIITGACVGVIIIIATAIFACHLRRKDKKASMSGSSMSSSEAPRKKGKTNPGYSREESVRPIAGDPVIQPRRVTEVYSANFNTEGLDGRSGAPAMYQDDPGLHAVNINFFDENRDQKASTDMPVGTGAAGHDVVYDNVGLERRYTIPRPYVDPAGLYPEVRPQALNTDYDNTAAVAHSQQHGSQDPPMPDYYEDDGSNTITRL